MVGTHDTASFHGGDITQTQSMSLTEQLKMGVRAMDIRCQHMNNTLRIYHGIQDQKRSCEEAISEVVQFLKSNPSETVLMKISADGTTAKNNTNTYEQAFLSVYNKYKSYFWVGDFGSIPYLGNVRGKIVILQAFSGGEKYGYRYGNATKQDEWSISNNWGLYDKWLKVNSRGGNGFYINFLSAAGGSFPYFVVSGQSSPQTNAPLLLTGKTTPGWASSYPDFPRISCLGKICSIAFQGTNQLTANYVRGKKGYFGIIMTDFPGPDLVDVIINTNF
jgi:1-phosphatidylinositol phosphodiesterase